MSSSWLLLTNATVVDGAGNPPTPNASVLVKDSRITDVGSHVTREMIPTGERFEEIDATGKTVMPGLIDAHCHMTYGESRSEEEIDLYTSPELRTLKAAFYAQKVLRSGVTSISQPGGSYYIGVGLREAIKDRIVQGPRMTSAGRYISTSNGLTDWFPDGVGVPEGSIGIVHNTLDPMIAEIRHQVKNGVDLIKLADSPFGDYQSFTNDEMKAMSDLTHQLGKKITIHARGSSEVKAAVDAGMDWIMHGNVMDDATVGALAESSIPLVPTLLLLANEGDWGHLVGAPEDLRDGMKRLLDRTGDALQRAHAAGVKMVLGTDSGFSVTPYGVWHARELDLLMTYAGLTSLEAIQAGTSNGALMAGLEGELGEVKPGYIADLIVVDGDPVADITVLQRREAIETVIQGGKVVVFNEEMLDRSWPHQRGLGYSTIDLTYELVHGLGDPSDPGRLADAEEKTHDLPDHPDEAPDLVSAIAQRERSAREF
jgi:imidazolonepropionase-like amidohydrolase